MHKSHAAKVGNHFPAALLLACAVTALGGCTSRRTVEHPSLLGYPPLTFSAPEVERVVLDCGAVIYLLPDHTIPLFNMHAVARAGSAYDPEGKQGLASLTAAVMRTGGTRRMSPDEIDRELEFMAARVSTSADRDSASVSLSCLSDDIEKALPLYLEILLHPAFAPDKIDLRKEQVREAIRRWNDEPADVVLREFYRIVYGAYPYAHPVIGEPGSMDIISRDDIAGFHRRYFSPSGLILGAAGDFDRDKLLARLNGALGTAKTPPPPPLPPVTEGEEASLNYIPRDTEQAHLVVGHLGIKRANPDYFSVMIMNEILGSGGFTSRILERLRSQEGLTYHAASYFTASVQKGLFYALCQTKEESATRALSLILAEMKRIRSEPVTEGELDRAKEAIINSFVFRFTTPSQIVEQMVAIEFYGLPRDYLDRYLECVSAVSREDVLRAARTYLHPDRAAIIVLGDREKFGKPLDRFGEVNTIDIGTRDDPERKPQGTRR